MRDIFGMPIAQPKPIIPAYRILSSVRPFVYRCCNGKIVISSDLEIGTGIDSIYSTIQLEINNS